MNETNMKHFKTAQIAGMEVGLKDLEKINSYALSKLEPKDIFAFKVSMAGNEIDRDYEVFPRSTLVKLANLFVGKTVVKDHDHRSDNQIARIYSTELVENDLARMTKTGEVFTQLVAKCYMVKTSRNADLIAEIQAGIRKEVSLGCRVDKAICSICGTDNVKTYCEHFPGRRYNNNQLCYFSLENASDAYELSFVAVPAQPHAGTVKSYGKKPFYKADLEAKTKGTEESQKNLHTRKTVSEAPENASSENLHTREPAPAEEDSRLTVNHSEGEEARLTVNRLVEEAKRLLIDQVKKEFPRLTVNHEEHQPIEQNTCEKCGCVRNMPENALKTAEDEPKCDENAQKDADSASKEPANTASETPEKAPSENLHTREPASAEEDSRLTVNRSEGEKTRLTVNRGNEQSDLGEKTCTQEESSNDADSKADAEQEKEASDENLHTRETDESDETRLTVNREESSEDPESKPSSEETAQPTSEEEPLPSEEDALEKEKASKAKEAEARIRALDLALSLRKRNQ